VGVELRTLNPNRDADACDAVVRSLPYFFGDDDGLRECAEAVRAQRGWVASDGGEIVGFATTAQTFPNCTEITWLAVRADRRRSGIGSSLVERVAAGAVAEGQTLLCALTLGPSVPEPGVDDGYEGTRRFWHQVGFLPVKEVSLRTWNNDYAVILVRVLH